MLIGFTAGYEYYHSWIMNATESKLIEVIFGYHDDNVGVLFPRTRPKLRMNV